MLLTKTSTPVIGWVAILLGYIMNWLYNGQYALGFESLGLCIILFTIVIYMLMTPLTYQQQKFSKLSAKMNPEIQAIQKKYQGKNSDQAAMAKMNEETQAVYAKYGVHPMGSCLQLVIQLPVLFALYRVIWNIPAYVDKAKAAFMPLTQALMSASGAESYLSEVASSLNVTFNEMTELTVVDVLYKFKPANWSALIEQFPDLTQTISETQTNVDRMNNFLGLNIADSPLNIIRTAWSSGAWLLLIGAILVPFLAWFTQYLSAKLMSSGTDQTAGSDSTAQTMKTMNAVMPLMSAVFCLTLPTGLGIYWIGSAVVRSIQQVVINKRLDKMDIEELAKQNLEKINKKRAKDGLPPEKMKNNATMTTRNIDVTVSKNYNKLKNEDLQKKAANIDKSASSTSSSSNAKPGSLAAKANMVADYNEKHKKR